MKITALALGLTLLTASATSFAWGDAGTYKVQAINTQVRNGAPYFNAYFLTATKAIVLYNLDKPDMQFLQKELEMAYQTGKAVTYMYNYTRDERKAGWYDINGNWCSTMSFLDIYSGDEAYFRIK